MALDQACCKVRAVAAQQHDPALRIAQQGGNARTVEPDINSIKPPNRLTSKAAGLIFVADTHVTAKP